MVVRVRTLDEYVEERRARDAEFREAYDALEPEYELRRALIEARLARGWTQTDLADRLGTTQSVIARLERGSYVPRVETLHKLAAALDLESLITAKAPLAVLRPRPRSEQSA